VRKVDRAPRYDFARGEVEGQSFRVDRRNTVSEEWDEAPGEMAVRYP
jgi:hypothetical protein